MIPRPALTPRPSIETTMAAENAALSDSIAILRRRCEKLARQNTEAFAQGLELYAILMNTYRNSQRLRNARQASAFHDLPPRLRDLEPSPLPPAVQAASSVVLVASAGGLRPILQILRALPPKFPASVIVLQHDSRVGGKGALHLLQRGSVLPVEDAAPGALPLPGVVYRAPGGFHLTLDQDGKFQVADVTSMGRINYVCPNADLLLCSVAARFGSGAIAVILSGIGSDGGIGCRDIRDHGGVVIAQHHDSADYSDMPAAAATTGRANWSLDVADIVMTLNVLLMKQIPSLPPAAEPPLLKGS